MVSRGGATRKTATRGRDAKRHGRADRDGDVAMGLPAKAQAGRIGKPAVKPGRKTDGSARPGVVGAAAQRNILKHAGLADAAMRDARPSGIRGGQAELKVTGWDQSRIYTNTDNGVTALIKWLEKKASTRLGSKLRNVTVKKSRVEDKELFINVASEDVSAITRMNGYSWAGANITIERVGGPVGAASKSTEEIRDMIKGVLERRYNLEEKFLDLSALATDEELKSRNVFAQGTTARKFFPAMMRVLEGAFDTNDEKDAAISSVSLANNDLGDLTAVSTLSETLPKLLNLDLSFNKFESLNALATWRRRFTNLQQLILSNNPIEQKEPDFAKAIINWYPNLRLLNGIQVRTDQDIANRVNPPNAPFPIKSPIFNDQADICKTFVTTFISGYDTDRAALATHYYDDKSEFSFAVNTQAPRDPLPSTTSTTQSWDHYIKDSRNLKRISQLPARSKRLFRGTQAIASIFAALPKTKHPDLALDARKWLIEASLEAGVPDVNEQYPGGVDGFTIVMHGEFDELDEAGQSKIKRSFDRTFVIGPGGASGVRVVSDMLTLRAYGGTQAFDPTAFVVNKRSPSPGPAAGAQGPTDIVPQLPPGLTIDLAEQMVLQLAKQTNLTIEMAKDCLEQQGWNYEAGLAAFAQVKDALQPSAFQQPN